MRIFSCTPTTIAVLGFYLLYLDVTHAQSCGKGATVGSKSPSKSTDKHDTKSGQMFMARDETFRMTCCGVISEWRYYLQASGTIRFHVWRGLGTGEYRLVGENIATYNAGEEKREYKYKVPQNERISVNVGDYLSWYSKGTPMIPYTRSKNELGVLITGSKKSPAVGDVIDWAKVKATDPRSYAIAASIVTNSAPKFVNLNSDLTITTGLPNGTEIFQLMIDDSDPDDHRDAVVTMEITEKYFSLEASTRSVVVVETPPSATYTLNFVVVDHCGASNKGTLHLHVKTKLPTIISLPAGATVREDSLHQETLLHALDVIHDGPIACELKAISPHIHDVPFIVRQINETEDTWGVYLKANAELLYDDINTFKLNIHCYRGKDADNNDLIITLVPNSPPMFDNLPANVGVSARYTTIGDVIYHVAVTDVENDSTAFNMTCDPEPCPFGITIGGSILLIEDLRRFASQLFHIGLYVEDRFHVNGPETLVVNITDPNRPPYFVNIHDKLTMHLPEDTPLGTDIFQVVATDLDENTTLEYSLRIKPSTYSYMFTIHSMYGNISSKSILDFEHLHSKTVKLVITVSDGYATVEGILKVSIIDVNEPPEFSSDVYAVTTDEGKPGKTVKTDIKVKDEDAKDSVTLTLDCGNDTDQYRIGDKPWEITLIYGFDVDALQEETHKSSCVITAVDILGANSTARLDIVINDIDDNAPEFEKTSYLFLATRDLPIFSTIGQARATDKDTASLNAKLLYELDNATTDFIVDENGTIYLLKDLKNTEIGSVFTFRLSASDRGRKSDSVEVTIVLLAGDYVTVTSSLSAVPITFFDIPANVAWFVTLVHLLIVAFGLAVYIIVFYFRCRITRREAWNNDNLRYNSNLQTHAHDPYPIKRNNLQQKVNGRRRSSTVSVISTNSTSSPPPIAIWKNKDSVSNRSRSSTTERTTLKGSRSNVSRDTLSIDRDSQRNGPWFIHDNQSTSDVTTVANRNVSSGGLTHRSSRGSSSIKTGNNGSQRTTDDNQPDVTSVSSVNGADDRKCSLSDIHTTYVNSRTGWHPWAISDFRSDSSSNGRKDDTSTGAKDSKQSNNSKTAADNLKF